MSDYTKEEITALIDTGQVERVDIDRMTGEPHVVWLRNRKPEPTIVQTLDGQTLVVLR